MTSLWRGCVFGLTFLIGATPQSFDIPEWVKIFAGAAAVFFAAGAALVGMWQKMRQLTSPSPSHAEPTDAPGEETLNRKIREDRYDKLADYVRDEFLTTRKDMNIIRAAQQTHSERLDAFEREWRGDRDKRDAKLDRLFQLVDDRMHDRRPRETSLHPEEP